MTELLCYDRDIQAWSSASGGFTSVRPYEPITGIVTRSGTGSSLSVFSLQRAVVALAGTQEPDDLSHQIAFIRQNLSMSIVDFARAAGVKRPTVYSWMAGTHRPHRSNSGRLEYLRRVAEFAQEKIGKPLGRLLHDRFDKNGANLLDRIAAEVAEEEIHECLDALTAVARRRAENSIAARMNAAGFPDKREESLGRGRNRALHYSRHPRK